METGELKLKLVNVYGEFIKEKVDITLRHQTLGHFTSAKGVKAGSTLSVPDPYRAPQGLYRLEIDPPSYLAVSQFVTIRPSGPTPLTITFPVDPRKVIELECSAYSALSLDLRNLLEKSSGLLGFEGKSGEELYEALDNVRKAGLLNIVRKTQATILGNGRTVFSYLTALKELRGDRFFATTSLDLRAETKNSAVGGLFHAVSEALHTPPDGFSRAGSFKTEDHYGNLQLSFFFRGDECQVDIDIDDAGGLGHVFQVVRNTLSGRPTHPYDIHEILVHHQQLDLGYRLIV